MHMKVEKGKSKKGEPLLRSSNLFPVVGVGASAGGLDAFKRLLKAIPENSGIAWVLVQHLDPTHESLLPSLLQKVTSVPVLEISDVLKWFRITFTSFRATRCWLQMMAFS